MGVLLTPGRAVGGAASLAPGPGLAARLVPAPGPWRQVRTRFECLVGIPPCLTRLCLDIQTQTTDCFTPNLFLPGPPALGGGHSRVRLLLSPVALFFLAHADISHVSRSWHHRPLTHHGHSHCGYSRRRLCGHLYSVHGLFSAQWPLSSCGTSLFRPLQSLVMHVK